MPARLIGMVCMIISMGASFIMSVSINPGAMQFTVIERLASSVARAFVAPMIPAFANATIFTGSKFNDFKAIYLIKGPFHIAPEIGFLWSFHKYVGLAIELAIPFHFPDKFNVHFDLSVGPYFQF